MVTPLLLLLMLLTAGGGRTVNSTAGSTLGCRDEDGDIVDWYVLYKLPAELGTKNNLIEYGLGYMYLLYVGVHPSTVDLV